MDALEFLSEQHRKVEELFDSLETVDEAGRADLVEQLVSAIERHDDLERDLFYPAVKKFKGLRELAQRAERDHRDVRELLAALERLDVGDDGFETQLSDLREAVADHILFEEDELFPQVSEHLDEEARELLGDELELASPDALEEERDHLPPSASPET